MNENRRIFMKGAAIAAMIALPNVSYANPDQKMDVFTALKTRRSVREYTDKPVSTGDIEIMLEAAMLAPSAVNEQPWEYVVIQDKSILEQIGKDNRNAAMASKAPLAILICLNTHKEKIKGMGINDVSMSAQNLLLAAHGLGLGAVYTGVYPSPDKMSYFRKLLELPPYVDPVGLIVIGHPRSAGKGKVDRFNPEAIHANKWHGKF